MLLPALALVPEEDCGTKPQGSDIQALENAHQLFLENYMTLRRSHGLDSMRKRTVLCTPSSGMSKACLTFTGKRVGRCYGGQRSRASAESKRAAGHWAETSRWDAGERCPDPPCKLCCSIHDAELAAQTKKRLC